MNLGIAAENVNGLGDVEREKLAELINVYQYHYAKNIEKEKYYKVYNFFTKNSVNRKFEYNKEI